MKVHFIPSIEGLVRRAALHREDVGRLLEVSAAGRRELQSLFDNDAR